MKPKDVYEHIGESYNRLKIISYSHSKKYTKTSNFYYICLCECGNKVTSSLSNLKSSKVSSCGCYVKEIRSLPSGVAALNKLIHGYKGGAKSRGYEFKLTKEQFVDIIKKDCYYCGEPPSNTACTGYDTGCYTYNGIDRVDNNKGYYIDNCVPCCKVCNVAKQSVSKENFLKWIERVYIKSIK